MIHRELVLLLGGALTVGARAAHSKRRCRRSATSTLRRPARLRRLSPVPPDGRSGRKVLRDGAAPGGRNGTTQLHQHFGRTGTDRACLDGDPELLHCRVFRSISRICAATLPRSSPAPAEKDSLVDHLLVESVMAGDLTNGTAAV